MATLYEYFLKEGSRDLTSHQNWPVGKPGAVPIGEIVARLHWDFPANAKYVSFYIPAMPDVPCPEELALNGLDALLKVPGAEIEVSMGFAGERMNGMDLVFSGRVYFYSERAISPECQSRIIEKGKERGLSIIFRGLGYAAERTRWEKPLAFISHDHRDKVDVAKPLAIELHKLMCPVWYDEFQ
jgi:hypothetical protein